MRTLGRCVRRWPPTRRAFVVFLPAVALTMLVSSGCDKRAKLVDALPASAMGPGLAGRAATKSEPKPDAKRKPESPAPKCEPQCKDRACGDDGCGGQCGSCKAPQVCDDDSGKCQACKGEDCPCAPSCDRRSCGSDGCGGECGTCDRGEFCAPEGRCRTPTCGNGMVEAEEECDGDDFCSSSCTRLGVEQSACLLGPTLAEGECKDCGCMHCSAQIKDCYLTGDPVRDAACRIISECAATARCANIQECVCGPGMCRPPDGPCFAATDEALDMVGVNWLDVFTCMQDRDCVLYRAQALGDCVAERCTEACLADPGR